MLKLSRYFAEVQIGNKVVLFSTRTSKVCSLNKDEYMKLKSGSFDELSEKSVEILINNEILIGESEDELRTIIAQNKTTIQDKKTFYQVIQPTAMCQLGCGYCGQVHTKDYLGNSVSDAMIERFETKMKEKPYEHVSVAWFGGEPLVGLPQMREMTAKLIAMADRFNCTYSAKIVTNGLSLKENIFLELVQKLKINNIEVTLDGIAEYHDKRRFTKEGLSSFDIIFNNLLKIFNRADFKELGCGISIRCNVDSTNFDGVKPLIRLLAEHNLQDKISYFYVAPIHSWGNEAHLVSLEKEKFAQMEMEWILEQYKYGFRPALLPNRKNEVCLSVTSDTEVFDAFGNVFDCSETPLVETYKGTPYILGNMKNGQESISSYRPLNNFYDEVQAGEYPCTKCPMLPTCGGGCPKSWREGIVACPSPKFNIKERLMLYYFIRKHGVDELRKNIIEDELSFIPEQVSSNL